MSETKQDRGLLKLLAEWPSAPGSDEEWENRARAITDSVAQGTTAASTSYLSDDELLSPALPSTKEEGHKSAPLAGNANGFGSSEGKMAKPERERRSFQDLARLASTPPAAPSRPSQPPSGVIRAIEAQASDSGVVDLKAAAASDPNAAARASQTPLASAGIFDEDDAPTQAAPLSQPASPVSQPLPSSQRPATAAAGAKEKSNARALLVGVTALAALAAGVFFVVSHEASKPAASVATAPPAAEAPKADPTPPPATAPLAAPAATAAATSDEALTIAQADDAPTKAPAGKVGGAKPLPRKASGPVAKNDAPPTASPAAPAPDPKLVAKDLPVSPPPSNGALGDAIKSSVGTADGPQPVPAPAADGPQFSAGSVPQKPSQGAVTGAIGAVLPAARACLKADDPVSRATITFAATGAVQGVVVSGSAAGKPAEACIKGALGAAKVPPFAQPTYTASVTVRPNG